MEIAILIFHLSYEPPKLPPFPQGVIPAVVQPAAPAIKTEQPVKIPYSIEQEPEYIQQAAAELEYLKTHYNCPSYTACLNVKYGTPATNYPEPDPLTVPGQ